MFPSSGHPQLGAEITRFQGKVKIKISHETTAEREHRLRQLEGNDWRLFGVAINPPLAFAAALFGWIFAIVWAVRFVLRTFDLDGANDELIVHENAAVLVTHDRKGSEVHRMVLYFDAMPPVEMTFQALIFAPRSKVDEVNRFHFDPRFRTKTDDVVAVLDERHIAVVDHKKIVRRTPPVANAETH